MGEIKKTLKGVQKTEAFQRTALTEEIQAGRRKMLVAEALAGLIALALILLIVLETQWIRWWHRRLKAAP